MKKLFFFVLPVVLLAQASAAFALMIDEKLTLRILKVSESQKTILINRGIEDGLTEKDHAKFFLTTGVVARGVVSKVSPNRSVWALYRLVNARHVRTGAIMELKISSPVKVSADSTRMIYPEDEISGTASVFGDSQMDSLPMDEMPSSSMGSSSSDLDDMSTLNVDDEKSYIDTSTTSSPVISKRRSIEAWAGFSINMLSSSITNPTESGLTDYSGDLQATDVQLGLEKYFAAKNEWYSRFSIMAIFHWSKYSFPSVDQAVLYSSVIEGGLGANFHFQDPFRQAKPIVFLTGSLGLGNVSDGSEGSIANPDGYEYKGSNTFMSFGIGLKYLFHDRYGVRAVFDYYHREEKYLLSEMEEDTIKTVAGPRAQVAVSVRF
jgi:hypothetical protein